MVLPGRGAGVCLFLEDELDEGGVEVVSDVLVLLLLRHKLVCIHVRIRFRTQIILSNQYSYLAVYNVYLLATLTVMRNISCKLIYNAFIYVHMKYKPVVF